MSLFVIPRQPHHPPHGHGSPPLHGLPGRGAAPLRVGRGGEEVGGFPHLVTVRVRDLRGGRGHGGGRLLRRGQAQVAQGAVRGGIQGLPEGN